MFHSRLVSLRLAFCSIAIFCMLSCQQEDIGEEQSPKAFFDLVKFFDNEVKRLNSANILPVKKANLNGREEEARPDELNYTEELQIFSQSDINRPSWIDKYQADTTFLSGSPERITYTALEEDLRTKKIEIVFDRKEVVSVSIENSTTSLVASDVQKLLYQPATGYSIENQQKIVFSNERRLRIEVSFN